MADYDTLRAELAGLAREMSRNGAVPGDWACLADMARDLAAFPVGQLVKEHRLRVARQADARSAPPA